jgi:hypothetical protein
MRNGHEICNPRFLTPFGVAETGQRAGEKHKKPWHASTPPARSTARRAALPGAGGRQRPHPGRASFGDWLIVQTR